jgi:hypothetical protein
MKKSEKIKQMTKNDWFAFCRIHKLPINIYDNREYWSVYINGEWLHGLRSKKQAEELLNEK